MSGFVFNDISTIQLVAYFNCHIVRFVASGSSGILFIALASELQNHSQALDVDDSGSLDAEEFCHSIKHLVRSKENHDMDELYPHFYS
jgi:hypothetical protein